MSATEFHAHVYFHGATERAAAEQLRRDVAAAFPILALGRVHPNPIAFHPTGMFQIVIPSEHLDAVIVWLQQQRQALSILVHPVTGDVWRDHTEHRRWLGRALDLNLDRLRQWA